MDILLNRRSVRMFDPNFKIPREDLEKIMTTAQNYPCSMGKQEADFLVVTNREILLKLSEELCQNIPEFTEHLNWRKDTFHVKDSIWCDASCVVFLVSNEYFAADSKELNMGEAAMSIIAAAEALGYSTLPVLMPANPAAAEYTSKTFNIPKEKLGLSVAIGKVLPEWKDHLHEKPIKSKVTFIE